MGSAGAKIPLELCDVPAGQIMRKQIPADKTADMVDFSKMAPRDRLASIMGGFKILEHGQSDYIRQFGMNITPVPLKLNARILSPPSLLYGGTGRERTIVNIILSNNCGTSLLTYHSQRPRDGAWNMFVVR